MLLQHTDLSGTSGASRSADFLYKDKIGSGRTAAEEGTCKVVSLSSCTWWNDQLCYWHLVPVLFWKFCVANRAVDRSPEGQIFGTLHFFFDAALPFVEVRPDNKSQIQTHLTHHLLFSTAWVLQVVYKKEFNVANSADMSTVTSQLATALVVSRPLQSMSHDTYCIEIYLT